MTWKRALLLSGGLVTACALGLAVVVLALEAGHLHGPLLKVVSARTGHPVQVGALSIRVLGGAPRVTAERVVVGSPSWMPGEDLAEIGTLTLTLQPTPRHPLKVRALSLEQAVLRLHRDETGRANWRVQEKPGSTGGGLLPMEQLQLHDVRVEFRDERRHLDFTGRVSTGEGATGEPLHLDARGELNGRAVEASLDGEPLSQARVDRPWRFRFEERSGGTQLTGQGAVLQPFDFARLDIRFEAEGPDLRDLYYLVGLTMPHTGPYTVSGELSRHPDRLEFRELRGRSGETDLEGSYVSKLGGDRPTFAADLRSRRARTRDIGARAAGLEREGPPEVLPDTRIPLRGLRARDGRVDYRADELLVGALTLRDLQTRIDMEGGRLTADPLTAGASGGKVSGSMTFDAGEERPDAMLDLRFADLSIGEVFKGKHDAPPLEARLNGGIRVRGKGDSLQALASSAEGELEATLGEGAIRESLAEILGFNLRGLGLMFSRSQPMVPLRCARAHFVARDGGLTSEQLVIDSESVVIEGSGRIDLAQESLDLLFRGRPKSMRFRLRTPLVVRGTLAEPSPRLEGGPSAVQGGAAVALGALITPVAAAVAFVDPGRARDVDCAALLAPRDR